MSAESSTPTASPRGGAGDRPRIAVLYDPRSTFALTLHGWVRNACDVIWVVDAVLGELPAQERKLLGRLGTVVDVDGTRVDDAIAAVGAARPSGIVTFADRRIRLQSALATALGLPGPSPECADRLVSKFHQRAAFADAGVDVPRVWRLPADAPASEVARVEAEVQLPVVLKPDEGDGSANIHWVPDLDALRAAVADARAARRAVVVEEFFRGAPPPRPELGDYLSVESVVSRGHVSHVALNGRFPVAWPFRETGFFIPALIPDDQAAAVLDLATAAIRSLGFECGCTHTEIKLTPDGPRVIEVNGRLGGGVPEMLHLAAGINLFEIACRVAAGEHVTFSGPVACDAVGYLFYVQAPAGSGRVEAIEGLDGLHDMAGVEAVRLNHPPGTSVDWHAGNHDYVYSVLGSTPNHDALLDVARILDEKVVITYVQDS